MMCRKETAINIPAAKLIKWTDCFLTHSEYLLTIKIPIAVTTHAIELANMTAMNAPIVSPTYQPWA
jgi:hypothetical protein